MSRVNGSFIGTHALPQNLSISQLRADVKGRVVTPEDADYDAVRIGLSRDVVRRPALIVRPVDAFDVSQVVSLARETGMELAIRSGGHSLAGFSTSEGGIVLDLSLMKGLEINVEERTAWAEAGLTAGEYTLAAAKYGLATGFGDAASVGLGGLTTGGGIGYLVRKYGLTIDNLLAARVVTADGEIRYTDAETHPDLFWAIRGGGGNFGVVTHFKFRLHEVDTIVGGMLILPATPEVISSFAAEAEAAPDELSTIANIMPAPPMPFIPAEYHGQIVVLAMMVYTGNVDEGLRVVAPFRKLAEPIVDMIGPMPYPQIYLPEDPNYQPAAAVRSKFIDNLDERAAQVMLDHLHASTAPMSIVQFRVLGGAMARVPADATAFAHRSSRIMVTFIVEYINRDEAAIHNAWVAGAMADLAQGDGSVYVNFLADEGEARVRDAYPNVTWEQMAAIKAKYDPTNLFHRNQNIAPKAE
ncbi:MAG: FAD-binding oxidoreductase [Chloroflexi bacterium]|nr:FAD-binding oxidoreductase [Chloroflexota bacterium]MDL1884753.1 FAD-binding oxidoreductase [Anaerolineae bacterium CFX8]